MSGSDRAHCTRDASEDRCLAAITIKKEILLDKQDAGATESTAAPFTIFGYRKRKERATMKLHQRGFSRLRIRIVLIFAGVLGSLLQTGSAHAQYSGPTVEFSSSTYYVSENIGKAKIRVILSQTSNQVVKVDFATANGTALAPADYSPASGCLVFPPGEFCKEFEVAIVNDALAEICETVILTLSNPQNANLGLQTATLVIIDDDTPPLTVQFEFSSYTVGEGQATATINVKLSAASPCEVTVYYSTEDGTATAWDDYTPKAGTLTFAPNVTTACFEVPIVNDAAFELSETINLYLTHPTLATLGTPSTAVLTIIDNDTGVPPVVQFDVTKYEVYEDVGSVTLNVKLSGTYSSQVTVDYCTRDGTAMAPSDYTAKTGTLVFAPGETCKPISVSIVNDTVKEADESFYVDLKPPNIGTLGTQATATVCILDNDGVRLIAYRTGGKFGEVVARDLQLLGDPKNFFILTNNDSEENPDTGARDYDNTTALIPATPDAPIVDDDLVKITLKKIPPWTSGSVEIVLSNPSVVRLFKPDGTQLQDTKLFLSSPSGFLAGLLTGDVDVWFEGLCKDTNFTFAVVYKDSQGQELDRSEVHVLIAEWTFRGFSGSEVEFLFSVPKQDIINKANGVPGAPDVPVSEYYKIRIDGLPTSCVQKLCAASASDGYDDEFLPNSLLTESKCFAVLYSSADSQDVVTASERTLIKQNLQLNVARAEILATVQAGKDEQRRKQGAAFLIAEQEDADVGVAVQRIIYESDITIKFFIAAKFQPKDEVEWDFKGDGYNNHPADIGNGKKETEPRVIKYSTAADSATNVRLTEVAANRRTTYNVKARWSRPGKEVREFERPIRVALKAKQIFRNLPNYVPGGAAPDFDKTNQLLLKEEYKFHLGVSGAPAFIKFKEITDPKARKLAHDEIGVDGAKFEGLMEQNRLILGRDRLVGDPIAVSLMTNFGEPNGFRYPDVASLGTLIYKGVNQLAFSWDKEELDFIVEHERNQLRALSGARNGTSTEHAISASYESSVDKVVPNPDKAVRALAIKAHKTWNILERLVEDLIRLNTGGVNGNASWNSEKYSMYLLWTSYTDAVTPDSKVAGSLGQIKAFEKKGSILAGTFQRAADKLVAMYKSIPKEWDDFRTIPNRPGPNGIPFYRLPDPQPIIDALNKQ